MLGPGNPSFDLHKGYSAPGHQAGVGPCLNPSPGGQLRGPGLHRGSLLPGPTPLPSSTSSNDPRAQPAVRATTHAIYWIVFASS